MSLLSDFFEDTGDVIQRPLAPENLSTTLTAAGIATGGVLGVAGAGVGASTGALLGGGIVGGTLGGLAGGAVGGLLDMFLDTDVQVPAAPGPEASPQEISEFNQTMEDFQLRQQGFEKVPNPQGGFSIREIPDDRLGQVVGVNTANQIKAGRRITALNQERLALSLEGKLPASSRFERLAGERLGRERLDVARGQGLSSTLGQQRLSRVESDIAESREAISRGELTSAQAIDFQRQGLSANVQQALLYNLQRGQGLELQVGQLAQQGQQFQQKLGTDLSIADANRRAGILSGLLELGGAIGGTALSA